MKHNNYWKNWTDYEENENYSFRSISYQGSGFPTVRSSTYYMLVSDIVDVQYFLPLRAVDSFCSSRKSYDPLFPQACLLGSVFTSDFRRPSIVFVRFRLQHDHVCLEISQQVAFFHLCSACLSVPYLINTQQEGMGIPIVSSS